METYSLYTYECGSLKIFGYHSSRAKHKSFGDAIKEYESYIERLKKVNNGKDIFVNKQVLIVKYTDRYQSEIIGVIKNGQCTLIKEGEMYK